MTTGCSSRQNISLVLLKRMMFRWKENIVMADLAVKAFFQTERGEFGKSREHRENPNTVSFDVASNSPLYFASQHDISHKDTRVPIGG
jgi:hypothetical protein